MLLLFTKFLDYCKFTLVKCSDNNNNNKLNIYLLGNLEGQTSPGRYNRDLSILSL